MLPGIGSIAVIGVKSALVGMATGGFYGTTAGTLMGAALGDDISQDQAKQYSDHLAQGNYLMIVEGSKEEISKAESILNTQHIQDWGIY
jgi:outer membrane lipoprotein SlyB